MRPSEKIADKILEILENNDLFKKINVFGWTIKDNLDENYGRNQKRI